MSNIYILIYFQNQNPPPSARLQNNDKEQVPYWRPTILDGPANLTVIWRRHPRVCKLIHIYVRNEKNCINYTDIIRCHPTKYSRPGNQGLGICAPLVSYVTNLNSYTAMTQADNLINFIKLRQLLANFSLRSLDFNPRARLCGIFGGQSGSRFIRVLRFFYKCATFINLSSGTEIEAVSETSVFCSTMTRLKNFSVILC
jgi:hypothetical protein